jgi:Protein of unknown function (DUF3040)
MSLSPQDQHVLAAMQEQLAASDPGLTGLMAIFARLTAGEAMPAREEILAWRRRARSRPGASPEGRRPAGRPGLASLLLLGWLVLSVAMISLAVALSSAPATPCRPLASAGCAQPARATAPTGSS